MKNTITAGDMIKRLGLEKKVRQVILEITAKPTLVQYEPK